MRSKLSRLRKLTLILMLVALVVFVGSYWYSEAMYANLIEDNSSFLDVSEIRVERNETD